MLTFTIEIPEDTFNKVAQDALNRVVGAEIRDQVEKQAYVLIKNFRETIKKDVEVYLSKRLTEKHIENEIDKAKREIIEETLRREY